MKIYIIINCAAFALAAVFAAVLMAAKIKNEKHMLLRRKVDIAVLAAQQALTEAKVDITPSELNIMARQYLNKQGVTQNDNVTALLKAAMRELT